MHIRIQSSNVETHQNTRLRHMGLQNPFAGLDKEFELYHLIFLIGFSKLMPFSCVKQDFIFYYGSICRAVKLEAHGPRV